MRTTYGRNSTSPVSKKDRIKLAAFLESCFDCIHRDDCPDEYRRDCLPFWNSVARIRSEWDDAEPPGASV